MTLSYSLNGAAQAPIAMTPGGGLYAATIPAQPDGTRVDYTVTGTAGAQSSSYSSGYFSGVTPIDAVFPVSHVGSPSKTRIAYGWRPVRAPIYSRSGDIRSRQ